MSERIGRELSEARSRAYRVPQYLGSVAEDINGHGRSHRCLPEWMIGGSGVKKEIKKTQSCLRSRTSGSI